MVRSGSLPGRRRRVGKLLILVCLLVTVGGGLVADWYSARSVDSLDHTSYVGRNTCAECHQKQHQQWTGSHHDLAMQLATDETVLANFDDVTFDWHGEQFRFFRREDHFFVHAAGSDGQYRDYQIEYTFGVEPLQQYMVKFDDGRIQVLNVAWDVLQQKWFFVPPPDAPDERIPPGDPMHWTGVAQNWNTMCAECHSTDLKKGYHLESNQFHTTFSEIDVSCEACHGPGSLHVELANSFSLFWDRRVGYGLARLKGKDSTAEIEACAPCHSRRAITQNGYRSGQPYHDFFQPQLLHEGLYHADGQILDEVYVYGSFLQSKMHAKGIRCSDCHQPHSLQLKYEGNRLCSQCHLPASYDTPTHHHHIQNGKGAQCIECHMASRNYMVIDPRHDHSFRIPRPDLSEKFGTPNTCTDCHTKPDETDAWAAEKVREWYGDKRRDDPHWTVAFVAGRNGDPQAADALKSLIERRDTPDIVRATAVDLLVGLEVDQTHSVLDDLLADSDPWVAAAAVRGWNSDDRYHFQRTLTPLLKDERRLVRMVTASRLADFPANQWNWEEQRALTEALDEFRSSHRVHLERASAHLSLGALERRLNRLDVAEQHFRHAIRLEPYLTGPRSELASVLELQGSSRDEIQRLRREELNHLERDAELLPDNAPTLYRLGLSYYLVGQLEKSEQALRAAVTAAPHDFDAHMALALILEQQQKWNEAVTVLRRMREIRPQDPSARQIYQRMQQRIESEK